MATVREHLQKAHEAMSAHHAAFAKCHKALADHFGKLAGMAKADSDKSEAAGIFGSIADTHSELATKHGDASAFHGGQAEDCAKAVGDSMNKLVPSNIHGVIPSMPIAVPRPGAPAPTGALPMAKVSVDAIVPDTEDPNFYI